MAGSARGLLLLLLWVAVAGARPVREPEVYPSIDGDPHLVGAQGTRFDFVGSLDTSYCLSTDEFLHINVFLGGYDDPRTDIPKSLGAGPRLRTWIQQVGIIWTREGAEHKLLLVARRGPESSRNEGFMAKMELDGVVLPRFQEGTEENLAGGLTIKFALVEHGSDNDVEHYSVQIAEMLDLDVLLTVAPPLLQTETDAEAHFGLGFNYVQRSSEVHGILGQTYREHDGRKERAAHFIEIMRRSEENIVADGPGGEGFLDGRRPDYVSSGVLEADCLYTAYGPRELPGSVTD